jgi:predicted transcriptional regulator
LRKYSLIRAGGAVDSRFRGNDELGGLIHLFTDESLYLYRHPAVAVGFLERCRDVEAQLNTVTIGLSSEAETKARLLEAFQGRPQGAFISFASAELLWKVITPKRWEILRMMTGAGPIAIREVARRVARDVKSVHGDIQVLLRAGVLDRTDEGRVVLPYDEVHVDFVLHAA